MHAKNTKNEQIFHLGEESFNIINEAKEASQTCNNNKSDDDDFDMNEFISLNPSSSLTRSSNEALQQSGGCCSARQKKDKYQWQYHDSLALIRSYGLHYEEKNHPMKKKYFWNNIANDLISQKYNVTEKLCQTKWNSLYQSYKECKDKTGRPPEQLTFFDGIDGILGSRPTNSSPHSSSSMPKKLQKNDKENNSDNNQNKSKKKKKKSTEDEDDERKQYKKLKLELEKENLQLQKEKCQLIKDYLKFKKGKDL